MSTVIHTDGQVLELDARAHRMLEPRHVQAFLENGALVVRNLLSAAELSALQAETAELVAKTLAEHPEDPDLADYCYAKHDVTQKRVPFRVEYVLHKSLACRRLMGHPFILRAVEALQGPGFVPTWDSMVFRLEGDSAAVHWHQDAGPEWVLDTPVFNVDFYLDGSDETNCLWAIPGSHRWPVGRVRVALEELRKDGLFHTERATPILMNPGDVMFHDVLLLHGLPPVVSSTSRVIYYEFRAAKTESRIGPHVPEYIELKQRMLQSCIEARRTSALGADEEPFEYRGSSADDSQPAASFRYPHRDYWRPDSTNVWW